MSKGLISHIQKYCLHDGPGIRTTVFLKGCPLTCAWCHNPETQLGRPEIMQIENRCIHCGSCTEVCPEYKTKNPQKENIICKVCGACVEVCPTGARRKIGDEMTIEQIMNEILKDQPFYEESGGGVTFSGGEPLVQAGFLFELLQMCWLYGIHTAVDTCGFCSEKEIIRLAQTADLILYDLKCMDSDKHKKWTGVSNKIIIKNLQILNRNHKNIWIRIPVVPGFNNTTDDQKQIALFIKEFENVRQCHLLPYHNTGIQKERQLGKDNELAVIGSLLEHDLKPLIKPFADFGLNIRIGG